MGAICTRHAVLATETRPAPLLEREATCGAALDRPLPLEKKQDLPRPTNTCLSTIGDGLQAVDRLTPPQRLSTAPVLESDIFAFFGFAEHHVHRHSAPRSQLAGASLIVAPSIDTNGNFVGHVDTVFLGLQDTAAQATINRDGNLLRTSVPSNTCGDSDALPGCLVLRLEAVCSKNRRCSAAFDPLAVTKVGIMLQAAALRSPGVAEVTGILTGVLPMRLNAYAVSSFVRVQRPHFSQPEKDCAAHAHTHAHAHAYSHTTGSEFGASGGKCEWSRTSSADTMLNRDSGTSTHGVQLHCTTACTKPEFGETETLAFRHQNSVPASCWGRGGGVRGASSNT